MSQDKEINSRKSHKHPYYGAKAVDKTCRNHGSDKNSVQARLLSTKKRILEANDKINDGV